MSPPWSRNDGGPGFRHHRRRRGPRSLRGYIRRRLRRRIFVWFGVSIMLSGMLAVALAWALSPASQWARRVEQMRTFVSGRFAEVWHAPDQRDALGRAIATDLEVGVRLEDQTGNVLSRFGPECDPGYPIPVHRDDVVVGHAVFCLPPDAGTAPPLWLAFVAGAAVLWGASGLIAWRLTRPLSRLVQATRAVGEGNLDLDIVLGHREADELRELAMAMRDMLARIRKQIDDQRELLAAVSHEIRTPLGHLRVLIELARQSGGTEPRIAEIEAEVLAIDRMVGQLVASSRVEFGTLDRRELDGVELALHALDRAGLDPTLLRASHERVALRADAALVEQALANLLNNARDHAQGVLELHVEQTADAVRFEVLDDGPGFGHEPGDVFAPFARGATANGGSLGLGLSLVRRIAQAHEGTVWATDRPAGGACVGFSIAR